MTTEQRAERAERTGFRLPWGGDRRTASPDPSGESDAPLEEPTDAGGETTPAASTGREATASAGEAAAHAEVPATPWVLAGAVLPAMHTMSEAMLEDSSPVRRQDGRARTADHVEWPAEDAARAQAPALAADPQPTTGANGEDATGAPESPAAAGMEETDMTMASETAAPATIVVPAAASAAHGHSPAPAPASPAARPSKFMADLSRAMQVAAQAAREESVAKVSAEAKQRIE